jgi:Uma2 family endonuclease
LTVEQYHRLIQAGALTEDDRVELLSGWLVVKKPHTPAHDARVSQAHEVLRARLPANWFVRNQSGLTTADSEPEPDLAVVVGPLRRYFARHPGPEDVGLVVEVADVTLEGDRDKGRVYAAAGLPVYWIVNIGDSQVEVYTGPSGPGPSPAYGQRQDFGLADTVPLVLQGQVVGQVPVVDLLG